MVGSNHADGTLAPDDGTVAVLVRGRREVCLNEDYASHFGIVISLTVLADATLRGSSAGDMITMSFVWIIAMIFSASSLLRKPHQPEQAAEHDRAISNH